MTNLTTARHQKTGKPRTVWHVLVTRLEGVSRA